MNLAINFGTAKTFNFKIKSIKDVIVDRKSKYTTVGGNVNNKDEIKEFLKTMMAEKYFQKATHNSFAYRIEDKNGGIIEYKNDDGETGAGNCILREMQREDVVNAIIVVTRYFGGIHLNTDRFKNVINSTKIFIGKNINK